MDRSRRLPWNLIITLLMATLLGFLVSCEGTGNVRIGDVFAPQGGTGLTVSSAVPNSGPVSGGTVVTVNGANFQKGATVAFGGNAAASVTFVSTTQLQATTPPQATAGSVDVVVTNPDGQAAALSQGFTYLGSPFGGGLTGSPGATATQFVLTYTAATPVNCTIEVSDKPSFSPLVHAVDPALFGGANLDGQTNVGQRAFVVGQRTIAAETSSPPTITLGPTACSRSGSNLVTCYFTGQPFVAGDNVVVTGMSNSGYNDSWSRMNFASANSFKYVVMTSGTDTSGGGTVTRANHYSLALQNNTTYYYRIGGPSNTCGATPSIGMFTTMNWPNGNTFAENWPVDFSGKYILPTVFETHDVTKNGIIDPMTGTLVQPMSLYRDLNFWGIQATGSGGQHHCTLQTDSNGYYHCYAKLGTTGGTGLWAVSPVSGQSVYLGQLYFPPNAACPNGEGIDSNTNSLWDSSDPDTLYGLCRNGSSDFIYKVVLTGNDATVPPGTYASVTGPTLVNTSSVESLIHNFDSGFDSTLYSRGTTWSVGGDHLYVTVARWNQNSPAWNAIYDLTTNAVVAAGTSWGNQISANCTGVSCSGGSPCRWCGNHGLPGIGGDAQRWTSFGVGGFRSGDNTMGYFVMSLGNSINGTDSTGTITVTSTKVGALGEPGDPMSQDIPPDGNAFLDQALPGDIFQFVDNNELVMVTARNIATSLTIARGCHAGPNFAKACDGTGEGSHATGAVLRAICWSSQNQLGSILWNYVNDPHGNDTTDTNLIWDHYFFGGHAGALIPWAFAEAWPVKENSVWDSAFMHQTKQYSISGAGGVSFGGFASTCGASACASYPHYSPNPTTNINWGWDTMSYVQSGYSDTSAKVSGTTYIYKYTFGSGHVFTANLPYFSADQGIQLVDISASNSSLTDLPGDNYKYCIAKIAGECRPGSSVGDIYANISNLGATSSCTGTEGGSASPDWCVDNTKGSAHGVLQIGLNTANQIGTNFDGTPAYGWGNSRKVVTGLFMPPRMWLTHIQDLPDQSWAYFDNCMANPHWLTANTLDATACGSQMYLVKIPPQPPADGVDRTNYENVPVSIGAGPPGATHARIKYGYEENGPRANFYCTQRKETCYFSNQNLPFNSTQTLAVGVPQRIVFFQVEYLNNSNAIVSTGPITAVAIP